MINFEQLSSKQIEELDKKKIVIIAIGTTEAHDQFLPIILIISLLNN